MSEDKAARGPDLEPSGPGSTAAWRGTQPSHDAPAVVDRRRRTRQIVLLVVVGVIAVAIVLFAVGFQFWRTNRSPGTSATPSADVASLNHRQTPQNGRPLILGDPHAPVTLTLYEDYHCPHCVDFEQKFGRTITDEQLAGIVKVELYPMSFIDSGSARAANAVACAAAGGFAATYDRGLFYNHTLAWNASQLVYLGKVTGAGSPPSTEFTACVEKDKYKDWVASINKAADANGITQTPTVLLNGKAVDVATLTPDSLKSQLETAAKK